MLIGGMLLHREISQLWPPAQQCLTLNNIRWRHAVALDSVQILTLSRELPITVTCLAACCCASCSLMFSRYAGTRPYSRFFVHSPAPASPLTPPRLPSGHALGWAGGPQLSLPAFSLAAPAAAASAEFLPCPAPFA